MIRAAQATRFLSCFMVLAMAASTECVSGGEGCDETDNIKVSMLQVKRAGEGNQEATMLDSGFDAVSDLDDENLLSSLEARRLNESTAVTLNDATSRKDGDGHGGGRSCRGRCGKAYTRGQPCQCNDLCHKYNSCCGDYSAQCAKDVNTGRRRGMQNGRWNTRVYDGKWGGDNTMTVYHQTSPEACKIIEKTNFKIGKGGWCGKAMYFAMSPAETKTKAITKGSGRGCMLEVVVKPGNILFAENKDCNPPGQRWNYMTNNWRNMKQVPPPNLKKKGKHNGGYYDSIVFHLGDGDEMIIYDQARIISKKIIPFNEAWRVKAFTGR